jgi:Helicase associated domain
MLKKQGVAGMVEDPWETKYAMLKDYKTKHGHTNVPQSDPNNKVSVCFYCDGGSSSVIL